MKFVRKHWKTAVLCMVLFLGALVILHTFGNELRLRQLRQQKLAQLHDTKGQISEDTLVLWDISQHDAQLIAERLNAKLRSTSQGGFSVLYLPEGMSIEDVYTDDACLEYLPSMDLDYRASTCAVDASGREIVAGWPAYEVTDPLYGEQSYLQNLNLEDTWEQTCGKGVTVAIIDTGIDTDHPEFAGRISPNSYNASTDKTVRDYGMSVVEDEQGHGTAVAGVLGASLNNGAGIVGIAPEVEMLVIKCESDKNGVFLRGSDLVFAMAYAIERDADVVNMSFSIGEEGSELQRYINLAVDSDIVCVAAAGNGGDSEPTYPAADPNVIGVGAFEPDSWVLSSYSNYGYNSDVLAPGTVYTTAIGGKYKLESGTSMASPAVAGAVALYLSMNYRMEVPQIRAELEASCWDLGSLGEDWLHGFGALNVYAFACGQKGTITYDMLTDEIPNQTQRFARGNTIQSMPIPERKNVIFDGWYYDPTCTDECAVYTEVFHQDITLYAAWATEDDTNAYIYSVLQDGTAQIQSYIGKRRYLTIPAQIDGYTVTSIGERAFFGKNNLRDVKLPDTLTHIGTQAFYYNAGLTTIEIPESVQSIDEQAFLHCYQLQSVGIAPHGQLQNLGSKAFYGCALTSFTIPDQLKQWQPDVLECNSRMHSIIASEECQNFCVKNDALYDSSGKVLYYYPPARSGSYTIEEGTEGIGRKAFYDSELSQIQLPQSLVYIAAEAFYDSAVEQVKIPSGVKQLGAKVWAHCSALSKVDLSEVTGLTYIPSESFFRCTRLRYIDIPDWIDRIGSYAFACSGLQEIHFGAGSRLTDIGQEAFRGSQLISFELPAGVDTISSAVFKECRNLSRFTFAQGNALTSIEANAFESCNNLWHVVFPQSLRRIGTKAFYDSGLKDVFLGEAITSVGAGAFSACGNLEFITVSAENQAYVSADGVLYTADRTLLVTYPAARSGSYSLENTTIRIEDYAFDSAENLTQVMLHEGLTEIGASAFRNCRQLQIPLLPHGLITIGQNAFECCPAMNGKISIPSTVISIGRQAFFQDYDLTEVDISEDSVLARIGFGTFANCGIREFEVPASVSDISMEAFDNCKNLTKITFRAGSRVDMLAAWTFDGADKLEEIVFEEGCALTHIEARALEYLPSLEQIDLSACTQLKIIDNYAFQGCSKLNSIILPEGLLEIGRYAFSDCKQLTELYLPKSISFIGRNAFQGTGNIKVFFRQFALPEYLQENWDRDIAAYYLGADILRTSGDWIYTLTEAGEASIVAYHGSAAELNLDAIEGHPIIAIGSGVFQNNTTLRSVTLPDTLLGIYKGAFEGTVNLESIVIPASVMQIEDMAFRGSGIAEVVLEQEGCLRVLGRYAFADTPNLTAIQIPEKLEKLQDYTFQNSGLRTVSFPKGSRLTVIGTSAFQGTALQELVLPAGMKDIGYHAFSGCSALERVCFNTDTELMLRANAFYQTALREVTIPANVNYVGEFCFADCQNLRAIQVDPSNPWYRSVDGVLYSADGKRLILCPTGKTGEVTIPAEVTSLSFGAFESAKVSSVVIPVDSRLKTLSYRSFFRCTNLEKITVPDAVFSIGNYAFAYCSSLKSVQIGQQSQLNSICDGAFYQCDSLEDIFIPMGVQEIGDDTFSACTGLQQMTLAEGSLLKSIGDSAFYDTAVQALIMPQTLWEIKAHAFENSDISKLVLNDAIVYIGDFAFANCLLEETKVLHFPENMEYLGAQALKGAMALEELTVPFLGTTVEKPARLVDLLGADPMFYVYPESLHTVHVLHGDLAPWAFTLAANLRTVSIPEDCQEIGDCAFADSGISSITLPPTLEVISQEAFSRCTALTEITLPASVQQLGANAFLGCSKLASITVEEGNLFFASQDGILYDKDMTKIYLTPVSLSGDIILPETLHTIEAGTFEGRGIRSVTFSGELKTIGTYAFRNCAQLESIDIPDSVTKIGSYAFSGCTGVSSIEIGSGLKNIPIGTFEYCGSKASNCVLVIREGIEELEYDSFRQSGIRTVVLPDSLVSVSGFAGSAIREITLGRYVTQIHSSAFEDCRYLTQIQLPESLQTIGSEVFRNSGLKTIRIPKNVTQIAGSAFSGCSSLTAIEVDPENKSYCSYDGIVYTADRKRIVIVPGSISGPVTIPEGVEELPSQLFENCRGIVKIVLPQSLETVGYGCFRECRSLETVVFNEGLKRIEMNAFQRCSNLKSVHLPDSLESLGEAAFADCTSLSEVTAGPNISFVGNYTFNRTPYLRDEVNWSNGILYLNNVALMTNEEAVRVRQVREGTVTIAGGFSNNSEILYLPDSVQYICNPYAISGSTRYIQMSRNLQSIKEQAFDGSGNLRTLHIPESVTLDQDIFLSETVDFYPELKYVMIETEDYTTDFKLCYCPNIETLVIPDQEGYKVRELWSRSSLDNTAIKNLVISGEQISRNFLDGLPATTNIFCQVSSESFPFTGRNQIYYKDEWHLATFWSDGILVQTNAYPKGTVVKEPTKETMEQLALKNSVFAGWDIDGDGSADKIPATLSRDLEAHAIWIHEHTPQQIPAVDPTCTKTGLSAGSYCLDCGKILTAQEVIPATGHTYGETVTAPTCTEKGCTVHRCHCGDSYTDSYVDALGHDMGQWFVATEATCTEDGLEQCDCSRCDYAETRKIAASGHSYESSVEAPTCTEKGYTIHRCHCGDSYKDSYCDPLGHSFTHYVSDDNATCTQDGTQTAVCDRCDAIDTVIVEGSAHGHDFSDWFVVKEATATEEGLEQRYCHYCDLEQTRVIARVENPFVDVPADAFYCEPVLWAVENGITNGVSANRFDSNGLCLRAHVVTFLHRSAGSPAPGSGHNPFNDVKTRDFFYEPVLWAVENGITNGISTTAFGSHDVCNRAAVVTFLWRSAGCPEPQASDHPFTDVKPTDYFYKSVLWAVEEGITNGIDATHFGPASPCSRAQVVTFLYRAYN